MADADLEEIRKARLAQLQQQGAGAGGGSGGGGADGQDSQKQQEAEARAAILAQILTPEAADRLGRIRLVKESRATNVENRLIMLARSGQLKSKITEDQLKDLLASLVEHEQKESSAGYVISRRKGSWDDDDSDFDV